MLRDLSAPFSGLISAFLRPKPSFPSLSPCDKGNFKRANIPIYAGIASLFVKFVSNTARFQLVAVRWDAKTTIFANLKKICA